MFELCVYVLTLSAVSDSLPPPWTVAHQAPLSTRILQARILEWVAMPSSWGSPQPRNQTRVSCIAGRFFTNWATREVSFPIYRCIYIHICVYIYTAFFFQGKGKYNDMFGKIWRLWDKHLCFFPLKLKCSLSSISAKKGLSDSNTLLFGWVKNSL